MRGNRVWALSPLDSFREDFKDACFKMCKRDLKKNAFAANKGVDPELFQYITSEGLDDAKQKGINVDDDDSIYKLINYYIDIVMYDI